MEQQTIMVIDTEMRDGASNNTHYRDCTCDKCLYGPHTYQACMSPDCPYCHDVQYYLGNDVTLEDLLANYVWIIEKGPNFPHDMTDYESDFVRLVDICDECQLPQRSSYLDNLCECERCGSCNRVIVDDVCDSCERCADCCDCLVCDECDVRGYSDDFVYHNYGYLCKTCARDKKDTVYSDGYRMGEIVNWDDLQSVTEGWLAPNGIWYYVPCYRRHGVGHHETAIHLGFTGTHDCEQAGYIHVSSYYDYRNFFKYIPDRPTKSQKETVNLFCKLHGQRVPIECQYDDFSDTDALCTEVTSRSVIAFIGKTRLFVDNVLGEYFGLSSGLLGD